MENILFVLLHIGITLFLALSLIKRAWNQNIQVFRLFPRTTSRAIEINNIQQTISRFRAIYVLGLWKLRGPQNHKKRIYSETKIAILFSMVTTLGALQSILQTQISQDPDTENINGFLFIPLISFGWCYFLAAILAIILDCYQSRFDKFKSTFKGIEYFEPLDPRPKIAFHIGNVMANLIVFGYVYGTSSGVSVPDFYIYLFGSFGVQLGIELILSLSIAVLGLNGLTRLAVLRTHIDKEIDEVFNQEQEIMNMQATN